MSTNPSGCNVSSSAEAYRRLAVPNQTYFAPPEYAIRARRYAIVGNSGNEFEAFANGPRDRHDDVEWLAKQPFTKPLKWVTDCNVCTDKLSVGDLSFFETTGEFRL